MMQLRTIAIGMLVGGICLAACGSEQDRDGVRPDPEVLGGKADLEPWMVLKQQSLDCGSTIAGAMAGFDSAHAYGFDALAGTLYTFDFDARFGPERGAVVAVYGPQGTLIQRERKTFSQQASVSFAASASRQASSGSAISAFAASASASSASASVCSSARRARAAAVASRRAAAMSRSASAFAAARAASAAA